jgi:hypothetical protein
MQNLSQLSRLCPIPLHFVFSTVLSLPSGPRSLIISPVSRSTLIMMSVSLFWTMFYSVSILFSVQLGCPAKLVSFRYNRNRNRKKFRNYPKQKDLFRFFRNIPKLERFVSFGCFGSIKKEPKEPKGEGRRREMDGKWKGNGSEMKGKEKGKERTEGRGKEKGDR